MIRTIIGEPETRSVWMDDAHLTPARSQQVWNHSPDGFNWGYEGSGPAQLALAILLKAGVRRARAIRLHQAFKHAFIAGLPFNGPFVLTVDVQAWVQAQPRL